MAKATPSKEEAPKTTAVAVQAVTPLANLSPGGLASLLGNEALARLAADAKGAAATERPSVSKISIAGGILSYMGEPVPNNEMEVVILVKAYENTYYDKPYNRNKITAPRCFALQMEEPDEVPMVPNPINDVIAPTCDSCPLHQWGSDSKGGRGKECKERRRLVLMASADLTSVEDIQKAELVTLGVPVMSVKNYAAYVNELNAVTNLPVYAVTTMIKVVPDPRSQFVVTFRGVAAISDPAMLEAVMAKRTEAERVALIPYEAASNDEEAEPAGKTRKY